MWSTYCNLWKPQKGLHKYKRSPHYADFGTWFFFRNCNSLKHNQITRILLLRDKWQKITKWHGTVLNSKNYVSGGPLFIVANPKNTKTCTCSLALKGPDSISYIKSIQQWGSFWLLQLFSSLELSRSIRHLNLIWASTKGTFSRYLQRE